MANDPEAVRLFAELRQCHPNTEASAEDLIQGVRRKELLRFLNKIQDEE